MAIHNDPSLAETYKGMKTTSAKEEARVKAAIQLEKEWNDMPYVDKMKLLEKNPSMTSNDYIQEKMKLFDQYYGKKSPSDAGEQFVVNTPQGSIKFNSQAEADAFKKQVGLK
jgi:hypothetical protein